MKSDLVYVVAGASLLLAVVLPSLLSKWAVSAPMVLLGLGMLIGLTPLPDGVSWAPQDHRTLVEHVAELTVLTALMGVGLALDRPLRLRDPASWRTWAPTWRLLAVAMPLTIAGVAVLGWWALGLAPASALLLGAALSPTDPVLASDVQVGGPRTGEPSLDEEEMDEDDEVRFTLTSEAGLNDSLAFPFVYAALLIAAGSSVASWGPEWVAWYLVGKVVIGTVAGAVVGWVLARVAFRARSESLRVAERGEPLLVIAALVTSYGLGQVAGGYGFLSVFVSALTLRSADRRHDYHQAMHQVVERLERLFTLFVLLVLGIALTRGLFSHLDWAGVAVAVALIAVVRPLSGVVALGLWRAPADTRGGLTRAERWAVAFLGVRGVGSIYYLAFAGGQTDLADEQWLWSTVAFTILLSVVVHGTMSTPVMRHIGDRRAARVGAS